jgi:hypothetical protein
MIRGDFSSMVSTIDVIRKSEILDFMYNGNSKFHPKSEKFSKHVELFSIFMKNHR